MTPADRDAVLDVLCPDAQCGHGTTAMFDDHTLVCRPCLTIPMLYLVIATTETLAYRSLAMQPLPSVPHCVPFAAPEFASMASTRCSTSVNVGRSLGLVAMHCRARSCSSKPW